MCYLVRQQQPEAELGGVLPAPGSPGPRARWIGAAGATLAAGLALAAALVSPPSAAPTMDVKERGAPVPVAARTTQLPAGGAIESGAGVDDGVPAPAEAKALAGPCHHGM